MAGNGSINHAATQDAGAARGFTMVELLVVLVIAALASSVVVMNAPPARPPALEAAERFAARLTTASEEAILSGRAHRLEAGVDRYAFSRLDPPPQGLFGNGRDGDDDRAGDRGFEAGGFGSRGFGRRGFGESGFASAASPEDAAPSWRSVYRWSAGADEDYVAFRLELAEAAADNSEALSRGAGPDAFQDALQDAARDAAGGEDDASRDGAFGDDEDAVFVYLDPLGQAPAFEAHFESRRGAWTVALLADGAVSVRRR